MRSLCHKKECKEESMFCGARIKNGSENKYFLFWKKISRQGKRRFKNGFFELQMSHFDIGHPEKVKNYQRNIKLVKILNFMLNSGQLKL